MRRKGLRDAVMWAVFLFWLLVLVGIFYAAGVYVKESFSENFKEFEEPQRKPKSTILPPPPEEK